MADDKAGLGDELHRAQAAKLAAEEARKMAKEGLEKKAKSCFGLQRTLFCSFLSLFALHY